MRIALLQAAGTPGDVAANLEAVRRAAHEAAGSQARLLVCPEAFLTGYNIGAGRLAQLAEPVDGPSVRSLQEIAGEAGLAVLCGYCERAGDAVHNSAVLVDVDASTRANYRKTHLFGELDRAAFEPGEEFVTADLDGVRVGLLLCYDIEFPEAARRMALDGVQLIAVPTALMAPAVWVAETVVPARAAENQVFVAYANRVGSEGDLTYVGRSLVAGPEGALATGSAHDEGLIYADIDLAAIERARRQYSYLDERRPALYES